MNMYESQTLKTIDEQEQPGLHIPCRTCIHGIWRVKSKIGDRSIRNLTAYCKKTYEVVYDSDGHDQIDTCDAHNSSVADLKD